jgi:hypothetical protein
VLAVANKYIPSAVVRSVVLELDEPPPPPLQADRMAINVKRTNDRIMFKLWVMGNGLPLVLNSFSKKYGFNPMTLACSSN